MELKKSLNKNLKSTRKRIREIAVQAQVQTVQVQTLHPVLLHLHLKTTEEIDVKKENQEILGKTVEETEDQNQKIKKLESRERSQENNRDTNLDVILATTPVMNAGIPAMMSVTGTETGKIQIEEVKTTGAGAEITRVIADDMILY